jgi:hypothetical protein
MRCIFRIIQPLSSFAAFSGLPIQGRDSENKASDPENFGMGNYRMSGLAPSRFLQEEVSTDPARGHVFNVEFRPRSQNYKERLSCCESALRAADGQWHVRTLNLNRASTHRTPRKCATRTYLKTYIRTFDNMKDRSILTSGTLRKLRSVAQRDI